MKYIRTAKGIYDVGHLKIDGPIKDGLSTEWFVAHFGKSHGASMPGVISINRLCNVNDIVEEADNIEELCDAVVLMREGKTPFVLNVVTNGVFNRTAYETIRKENGWKLILGIYTDKGLIYVAKMNKEGELCLL